MESLLSASLAGSVTTLSFNRKSVAEFELNLTITAGRFSSSVLHLILSSDESPSSLLILSDNLDVIFPDLLLEPFASRGRSRGILVVS